MFDFDRKPVKALSAWQRKVLDQVLPEVAAHACEFGGTVRTHGVEVSIRTVGSAGIVTLQVVVRGKPDDQKLEVTGVNRRGKETKRTVFSLNPPEYEIDPQALRAALAAAAK